MQNPLARIAKLTAGIAAVSVLLLAIPPAAFAQMPGGGGRSSYGSSGTGKEIQLFGGLNMANLGSDAEEFGNAIAHELTSETGYYWTCSKKAKTGFDIGMAYVNQISPLYAAVSEIHYVQRGLTYDLTVPGYGVTVSEKFKLNYLEAPVLARFTFGNPEAVRPFVQAGALIGLKVGASMATSGTSGNDSSVDMGELFKTYYVGAIFGGGVDFRMNSASRFVFQGRYVLGLTNLLDDSSVSLTVSDLSFLAGISFDVGR